MAPERSDQAPERSDHSPEVGCAARLRFVVGPDDTARALGSGDLEVLATPRLLAWIEAATCAATVGRVPEATTTVGTRVDLAHLAASPVGAMVLATAELVHVDGRLLRFTVTAQDEAERLLANGSVTRVVVDRERFLDRVRRPG